MHHSDHSVQEWEEDVLFKRGVQEAISAVISECPSKPADMLYYPSFPVKLNGFLVSLVLGLQKEVLESHPSLSIDRVNIHECRSFRVAVSLIDAVVLEFLEDVSGELLTSNLGAPPMTGKSPDEILRAAGNRLMLGAAYRADRDLEHIGCWQTMFDVCNRISSLKYEQAAGAGRLILARKGHPALKTNVTFAQPVVVHNARASRKLLELASKGSALHMDPSHVFGLVEIGEYAAEEEDLYEISVRDHYIWELTHSGQVLMRVRSGQPSLPAPPFDENKIRKDLARIFRDITVEQVDRLISLVSEAAREKHGTMLVVSEDATNEAQRLANQGTRLEPRFLTACLLRQLTAIDGAVLVDPECTCHAIGVILDGLATEKGDPARGARFNSAFRYVDMQRKPCMAIVVSEDGGVDLVPNLRPAIRLSLIEKALDELERLLTSERVNKRRYRQLIDWLGERRFYLLAKHCEMANRLIATLDDRLAQEDTKAPHIVRHKFTPDSEFVPDIYYEDEERPDKDRTPVDDL